MDTLQFFASAEEILIDSLKRRNDLSPTVVLKRGGEMVLRELSSGSDGTDPMRELCQHIHAHGYDCYVLGFEAVKHVRDGEAEESMVWLLKGAADGDFEAIGYPVHKGEERLELGSRVALESIVNLSYRNLFLEIPGAYKN